jgi:hypothetical protein
MVRVERHTQGEGKDPPQARRQHGHLKRRIIADHNRGIVDPDKNGLASETRRSV